MVLWMTWSKGIFQPVANATLKQVHLANPLHSINDENKNKRQIHNIHNNKYSNKHNARSLSPVSAALLHTTPVTSDTAVTQQSSTTSSTSTQPIISVPYNVHRTASQQLPVYTDYKRGQHIQTILRRFTGDQTALSNEIRLLLGPHVSVENRNGKIVIDGQYTQPIKQWLEKLGF